MFKFQDIPVYSLQWKQLKKKLKKLKGEFKCELVTITLYEHSREMLYEPAKAKKRVNVRDDQYVAKERAFLCATPELRDEMFRDIRRGIFITAKGSFNVTR